MSTFTPPVDIAPITLAKSSDINAIKAATATAFALLPSEDKINKGTINYAVDTGVSNAYAVSISPSFITSYTDGLLVSFRPLNSNTGASAINVNGLGAKAIRLTGGGVLSANEIVAGAPIDIRYSSATGFFHTSPNSSVQAIIATQQASAAAISASKAEQQGNTITATSTTSTTIEKGGKTFVTQVDKQFQTGQTLKIVSRANTANFMNAIVTSYSTTSLVVNVDYIGGSGTFADWNIGLSGVQGIQGVGGSCYSQEFTSTTGVWTKPAGVTKIRVTLIGAGGGGCGSGASATGAGGGEGATIEDVFTVTGDITVAIGAGGTGGTAGNAGSSGGSSVLSGGITTLTAGGGTSVFGSGGLGGAPSVGTKYGQKGDYSINSPSFAIPGGKGGGAKGGVGIPSQVGTPPVQNSGCGGCGAGINGAGIAAGAGGVGANGYCLIEWVV